MLHLPIKTHAVKIRYREQMLKQMVHGRFGTHHGCRCVFVFYDPNNDSVSQKNQKRYSIESKQGRHYAPLIERFLILNAEYEKLPLTQFADDLRALSAECLFRDNAAFFGNKLLIT